MAAGGRGYVAAGSPAEEIPGAALIVPMGLLGSLATTKAIQEKLFRTIFARRCSAQVANN
jgi:hypothetical protein